MRNFKGVFVTGTDTGIGKTRVSVGLMESLKKKNIKVSGMKPVASGCFAQSDGLKNEDAVLLQGHCTHKVDYSLINYYAFEAPISPHIAAKQAGNEVSLRLLHECYVTLEQQSEFVVVEGVGGWEVPLNRSDRVSDLAKILGLPVVLVVGLRLGCLNHALLTESAILNSGCELIGWVGNRIDPEFACLEENVTTLTNEISAPLIGIVPFNPELESTTIADCFDIDDWVNCRR